MAFYEQYAQGIGEKFEFPPEVILDILNLSEKHRVLYHGVKRRDSLENIEKHGLRSNTPESGYGNCCGTGLKLFLSRDSLPILSSSTFDTPFFHYAHNKNGMSLVVTDQQTLQKHGIGVEWKNNNQINVRGVIPPEAFSLLDLTLSNSNGNDYFKKCNAMLEILQKHLSNYSVGRRIYSEITV